MFFDCFFVFFLFSLTTKTSDINWFHKTYPHVQRLVFISLIYIHLKSSCFYAVSSGVFQGHQLDQFVI